MLIVAKCPKCSNAWLLDSSAADRRIKCPQCNTLFKVPTLDELSKAARIIRRAKGTVYVDEKGQTYG